MKEIVLACVGIFLGEFYGNFVGGGSIVTQFVLQNVIGMDLKSAIALDNAAAIGSEVGLLCILFRHHRLRLEYLYLLCSVLVGTYFGALILYAIPVEYLKAIFVAALVAVVAKSFLFSKEEEHQQQNSSQHSLFLMLAFGIALGTYNALLSIGDTLFGLLVLLFVFRASYQRAIFLLSLVFVVGRSFAMYQYVEYGFVDMQYWVPMFFSTITAGLISGSLLQKLKTDHVKPVLRILGLLLAVHLAWKLIA